MLARCRTDQHTSSAANVGVCASPQQADPRNSCHCSQPRRRRQIRFQVEGTDSLCKTFRQRGTPLPTSEVPTITRGSPSPILYDIPPPSKKLFRNKNK